MTGDLTVHAAAPLVEAVPPPPRMDAAARINYYHALSKQAGALAVRAALAAGLELVRVQLARPGRLFDEWVEANCSFARRTAFRYMATVRATIGAEDALGRLLEGSDDDRRAAVEDYAAQTDQRSLAELYADLGIVHRTKTNWGGARPGAGRPVKDAAGDVALEPALWAAARGALDGLVRLDAERDFLHRLSDDHLAAASQVLLDLSAKASRALTARIAQPQPPET